MLKIRRIGLEDFRAYTGSVHWLDVNDFTAIVGRNDVGKSTWLEALAIFFEDSQSCKPDKSDLSIGANTESFSIYVSFTPTDSIVIDKTNQVSLSDEYLLDESGLLTIRKKYKNGKNIATYISALHPTAANASDLLKLKLDSLKQRASSLGIDDSSVRGHGSLSKAASWRKSIREAISDLEVQRVDVEVEEESAKKVWTAIQKQLPTFGLFRVDRDNSDQDGEAQDPFKTAIKNVLASPEVTEAIENLKNLVKSEYLTIANSTLQELRSINPEIAEELVPNFGDPKLESAFKPVIETDNGVPLNKRGSGVRRLVLLSFFCAEAKRKSSEGSGVIYAVEEPETSQHPTHQNVLIDALLQLSRTGNQVLITTHSPQLLKQVDIGDVRYVKKQTGQNLRIIESNEDVLVDISTDLGQLPKIAQGCLICVEGPNDVRFLRHIGQIPELKALCDLSRYSILPLIGGNLIKWTESHPLGFAEVHEFHLYDRDATSQYADCAHQVSAWNDCCGMLTKFETIENYLHPNLINEEFGTTFTHNSSWGRSNVPLLVAQETHLDVKDIKNRLNDQVASRVTKETLEQLNAFDEVKSWFTKVKELSH